MDDIRPILDKKFESLLRKQKKVKICVTVSFENEENLHALTRYHNCDSYSSVVNLALSEFFKKEDTSKFIQEAKDYWRSVWEVFRKQRK